MQSSTAIAFRALIMLIFLISVPLLAIFGKDLPEVIKGVLDGRLSVQVAEQPKPAGTPVVAPPAPADPSERPNPFAEPAPYRAPPLSANQLAPLTPPPATPAPGTPPNLMPPAEFPNPATPPVANGVTPTGNLTPTGGGSAPLAAAPNHGANGTTTVPDAFQTPPDSRPIAGQQPLQQATSTDGLAAGSAATTGDDKFRQAETRLRELGATQYILETWGPQNEQYRFTCRMAIGQSVGVTQHFEAVKGDPWQAMQDVLRQVEDWQKQSIQ